MADKRLAEQLYRLATVYKACFATESGVEVLKDLSRIYDADTLGPSPRQTEKRAAQRQVLLRIRDMITIAESGPSAIDELARAPQIAFMHINPWTNERGN